MTEQVKAHRERRARLTKGLDFNNKQDVLVSQAIHNVTSCSGITLEAWREALRRVFGESKN